MNKMKCTRCKAEAFIKLESHNTKFCDDCFDLFFLNAVKKALKSFGFTQPDDSVTLVTAVSGGKDSLAAWDALRRLGYKTVGLHLDLGNDDFTAASIKAIEDFADPRGLEYRLFSLKDLFGYTLPQIDRLTRRDTCAVCGSLKRGLLNRAAKDAGGDIIVTGHHLDDEAGRLLGNLVRNRTEYLDRFYPYLPSAHPNQAGRMKPLYRVDQIEIRHYCRIHGIKPAGGDCPFSKGATSRYFQESLHWLEDKMPGTKRDFLFTYLAKRKPPEGPLDFGSCQTCGQPTWGDSCGVCNLRARLDAKVEKLGGLPDLSLDRREIGKLIKESRS